MAKDTKMKGVADKIFKFKLSYLNYTRAVPGQPVKKSAVILWL